MRRQDQARIDLQSFGKRGRETLCVRRCRIAFIAIKPSPSRMRFIPPIQTANRLIQESITGKPKLVYVDVFTPMLGADGQPRAELFVGDQLHLSDDGYKLWAGIVKPVLEK